VQVPVLGQIKAVYKLYFNRFKRLGLVLALAMHGLNKRHLAKLLLIIAI
jgi:hypothetical protein